MGGGSYRELKASSDQEREKRAAKRRDQELDKTRKVWSELGGKLGTQRG